MQALKGGPPANSMASSFQSQMAQSVANFHSSGHHNVPNGESNMFYDHHNMNSSQNNINQMAQPSQYLEAPGWPTMNGHAQPPPNYAQHQNLGGNLSRCYSDNNLYQSTPNIKLKSANIEPVNHEPVNPLVNNSHPPSALTSVSYFLTFLNVKFILSIFIINIYLDAQSTIATAGTDPTGSSLWKSTRP